MMEKRNGFTFIDGQRIFSVEPDDFIWRLRDNWLSSIKDGHQVMLDTVIPHLEREAVSRFGKEFTVPAENRPKMVDGFEDWRMWWLNEARHNCDTYSPVGCAGNHLSKIGQAAVNILMAASALRDAMESGTKEETAAISMLLICEAIAGGYGLESDATRDAHEAATASKKQAYEAGAGKSHKDLQKANNAAVAYAKKHWSARPEIRIGEMAEEILKMLKANKEKLPSLEAFPKPNTIKTWLRNAGAEGKLQIPAEAQKRGRRKEA